MGDPAPELREGRTEAGCTGGDSAGSAPGGPGERCLSETFPSLSVAPRGGRRKSAAGDISPLWDMGSV